MTAPLPVCSAKLSIGKDHMSPAVETVPKMAIRVNIDLVLEVAAAADDSGVRLNVDVGGGVVVGEPADWLLTRMGSLVVLDDNKGVMLNIAFKRDVFIIVLFGIGIESGHGQVGFGVLQKARCEGCEGVESRGKREE
jgi:hypothetical protein